MFTTSVLTDVQQDKVEHERNHDKLSQQSTLTAIKGNGQLRWRNINVGNAELMQNLCRTNAEPMQNQCRTSSSVIGITEGIISRNLKNSSSSNKLRARSISPSQRTAPARLYITNKTRVHGCVLDCVIETRMQELVWHRVSRRAHLLGCKSHRSR